MKNYLFALFLFLVCGLHAQFPAFDYAFSYGGNSGASKVIHDDAGNYLVFGTFSGDLDLDPSDGALFVTSAGSEDVFVAAHSAAGDFIWGNSYGGVDYELLTDVKRADDGSIYLTGVFEGQATEWGNESHSSNGDVDCFVVKLDPLGSVVWSFTIGGILSDGAAALELSDNGNILLWGQFSDQVDFDPSENNSILTTDPLGGGQDLFVASYTSQGEFSFVKRMTGSAYREAKATVKFPDGSFLLTGVFSGTLDVDPSEDSEEILSAGGSLDAFLARISDTGTLLWSGQLRGVPEDESALPRVTVHDMAAGDQGEVYLSGEFDHTVDFDPGNEEELLTEDNPDTDFFPGDGFIMKLNQDLGFEWVRYINAFQSSSTIAVDNGGNPMISGNFHGQDVDLNTDEGAELLVSTGDFIFTDFHAYIINLSQNGDFISGSSIGQEELRTVINAISIAPSGQIATAGTFNLTVDFDPGEGVFELTAEDDLNDAFLLSLQGEPLSTTLEPSSTRAKVYPNPSTGLVHIELLENEFIVSVRLRDAMHRLLFFQSVNAATVDVSSLPSGIYFLHIETSAGVVVKKVVKAD